MKKTFVLVGIFFVFFLIGCGGSKIQLNNATGISLANVVLTIDGNSESWSSIERDETFGSSLVFPEQSTAIKLEWEIAGEYSTIEYFSIDSAYKANRISILFAPDEMSVSYQF